MMILQPTEDDKWSVQTWAARGLERGEITQSQHKFVTDLEKLHPVVPKPPYKTHHTDTDGRMLDPFPFRNLTVGIGTPVHPLSKLS